MLTINKLNKHFGSKKVLSDLSFKVDEGSIFGFVGQNGAGKTTTMKIILGLLNADSGEILVNGEKVTYGQNNTNKFIGYLPDVPEFYPYMTAAEYLTFCGKITGMEPSGIKSRTNELLALVGLEKEKHRIKGFSRGMKQRLGIAQALLNQPRLLICDEPTSALDPVGRKEILDILVSAKEQTTVLFSTHILTDVERICDKIAFLNNGNIALSGTLDEIRKMRKAAGFEIELDHTSDTGKLLSAFPNGKKLSSKHIIYNESKEQDMMKMMHFIVEEDIPVIRIEQLEPTLESLFMEVVGK